MPGLPPLQTARKRRQRKKLSPPHPLQQGEGGSRGHVQDVQQFADRNGSQVARLRGQRDPPASRNKRTASLPQDKATNNTEQTSRRSPSSQKRGRSCNSKDTILRNAEWEMQQNSNFYKFQEEEQGRSWGENQVRAWTEKSKQSQIKEKVPRRKQIRLNRREDA